MSRTSAPPAPISTVVQALARERLGIPSVVYFALSGVAPLTVDLHAPWWSWALGAWAVVTALGLGRVEVSGKILAGLGTTAVIVVVTLSAFGLTHPAGGHVSFASLDPDGSLVATHFATLLGVPDGSTVAWALPAMFAVLAVAGIVWALVLRSARPAVYAAIGFGPRAAAVSTAASYAGVRA
jgi:hypothetical protein